MASANLRILGAFASRAGDAWGGHRASGCALESSPDLLQEAIGGARTPKTQKTPSASPSSSPLASPKVRAIRAPAGSPTAVAHDAPSDESNARQLPRLLGRINPATSAACPGPRRAEPEEEEEDPATLAAEAAREAFLARQRRIAERRVPFCP